MTATSLRSSITEPSVRRLKTGELVLWDPQLQAMYLIDEQHDLSVQKFTGEQLDDFKKSTARDFVLLS